MTDNEIRQLDEGTRRVREALNRHKPLLMKLSDALALLPGVQPRNATACLRDLASEVLEQVVDKAMRSQWDDSICWIEPVPGLVLTANMTEDILPDPDEGARRITPRGAAILLRLYEAGELPTGRAKRGEDVDKLRAYAASENELLAQAETLTKKALEDDERWKWLVANPSQVAEDMFDYRLLDDIFIARFNLFQGAKTMEIGGIDVTKSVSTYQSNRGKSQGSAVSFRWTGSDGQAQVIEKGTSYASNRRNDPERNYGLPE